MAAKRQIIIYQIHNLIRSRWLLAYTIFFLVATTSLIRFLGADAKMILSLMNVVILIVPLVCLVFGGIYFYNSREFIQLLASQPIRRTTIFSSMYLSMAGGLSSCLLVGVSVPLALHRFAGGGSVWLLLAFAIALTFIFTALALWIAVRTPDKAKGIGMAIFLWLCLAVLYDGIILLLVYFFSDYPLESAIAITTILNPIDLVRVVMMMQLDVSALMGYTGAVFQKLLQGQSWILMGIIGAWVALPYLLARRHFLKRDL